MTVTDLKNILKDWPDIDSEANRLAAEKTVAIQNELTELKTLMQKFTKARQAIMDVRL